MDEQFSKLQDVRTRILNDLVELSGELADTDSLDVESMIALAQATGKLEVYNKALDKVESISDASEKADALLVLLGNVEDLISTNAPAEETTRAEQNTPGEPAAANPSTAS